MEGVGDDGSHLCVVAEGVGWMIQCPVVGDEGGGPTCVSIGGVCGDLPAYGSCSVMR
jgi:hypothetical protein